MNPLDTLDFYCSDLVYYAWKYAGFDIASGRGSWILPINIIAQMWEMMPKNLILLLLI